VALLEQKSFTEAAKRWDCRRRAGQQHGAQPGASVNRLFELISAPVPRS
jgi:hypothetical protein